MSGTNSNYSSSNENNSMKKTTEKYSLRQRQKRAKSPLISCIGNSDSETNGVREKQKPKAAPLSKYRRKTANARERTRMREINCAFENLRKCVPQAISGGRQSPINEKLTKITTLRLAMKYISTLSQALVDPSYDTSFLVNDGENNNFLFNNNNNNNNTTSKSVQQNLGNNNKNSLDIIETQKLNSTLTKNRNTNSKSQTRCKLKGRHRNEVKLIPTIPSVSPLSGITMMKNDEKPTDLGLLLESDGESLHLSEPCLSPLDHQTKPFRNNTSNDNSLVLGLLLESDSESLQFSENCLSPLASLDSFNPFSDFLHSEFTEQTSLDIYLT